MASGGAACTIMPGSGSRVTVSANASCTGPRVRTSTSSWAATTGMPMGSRNAADAMKAETAPSMGNIRRLFIAIPFMCSLSKSNLRIASQHARCMVAACNRMQFATAQPSTDASPSRPRPDSEAFEFWRHRKSLSSPHPIRRLYASRLLAPQIVPVTKKPIMFSKQWPARADERTEVQSSTSILIDGMWIESTTLNCLSTATTLLPATK